VVTESPQLNMDAIKRFTQASPELLKHFSVFARAQRHIIKDVVQSFNKDVLQQGFLDAAMSRNEQRQRNGRSGGR